MLQKPLKQAAASTIRKREVMGDRPKNDVRRLARDWSKAVGGPQSSINLARLFEHEKN